MNYDRSAQVRGLLASIKKDGLGKLRERQRAAEGREQDDLAELLTPPGPNAGLEVGLIPEAANPPSAEEPESPQTGTKPPRPKRQSSLPGVPPKP